MTESTDLLSAAGPLIEAFDCSGSLSERLARLHKQILETMPCVDRVACALYDGKEGLLKTFLNSTRVGEAIAGYQYRLADSRSLSEIVRTGRFRVLHDIPQVIHEGAPHSDWLLKQGYRSSLTVPMHDGGAFAGFIFFDSVAPTAFVATVQRDLMLYCSLINMSLSQELAAVRSVLASAHVARDFAGLRDFETGAHLERMARYSRRIAQGLASSHHLSDEFVEHIHFFAPVHDIGKIGIPDAILLKPGKLDAAERAVMESHVAKGTDIVRKIIGEFGLQQLPDSQVLLNIIACHHEFLDGSGYPNRLSGADVPLEARIVTTADIFDALTTRRPYKRAWTVDRACGELRRMVAAGKLDPACVAVIEQNTDEFADIGQRYQDEIA